MAPLFKGSKNSEETVCQIYSPRHRATRYSTIKSMRILFARYLFVIYDYGYGNENINIHHRTQDIILKIIIIIGIINIFISISVLGPNHSTALPHYHNSTTLPRYEILWPDSQNNIMYTVYAADQFKVLSMSSRLRYNIHFFSFVVFFFFCLVKSSTQF